MDSRHGEQVGDAGAQAIAEALKVNMTITQVDLWQNQIGEVGARALAETLKVNETVTWIAIWDNQIGDAGASAIAEALKVNKTVTEVVLGGNQISDIGASAIAEALGVNKTVTRLNLDKNQIGSAGAQALAEAFKVNTTVTDVDLGGNQISDIGASAIAEALKVNKTVTRLDLDKNQIGSAGAQALAEAFKVNKTLAWLNLSWNCIGDVGIQAIADAFESNPTLTDFYIGNQCSPLVPSLLPRLATADELQAVFGLLTSGRELEDQLASLPALPTEIADLIMDEACYWQGLRRTRCNIYDERFLQVTVPRSSTGNAIRVQAMQVLLDMKYVRAKNPELYVVQLIVRDTQGAVQYECTAKPTLVDSTLWRVTILPANHPVIRQMREGWTVDVQPSKCTGGGRFESLHVGYIERQYVKSMRM
ncbi:hypothetical protein, variant 2 [Capsaspora owczarzaki ATCC 30864]|uniref:NOD3 protein n=1 Tax=Capsaspora owczarzaki (strain ATCC 30864) TaxID=595528 RepID=A0A0D2X410_CAPO3|nr:hypothetical protein CAOG_008909 [Capsaspora owczarzaki ATCC 30864]KJE95244.1 hypothetical protein, variant 1 [Capsaspora owczarzaki ATCC 30864]KJE95245.1 hypothetical protein, variant 2 [Capsaspora owczarzaki ATCC 30864]